MSLQPERLRVNTMDLGKNPNGRALRKNIKTIEDELRIAAKILDWEIGALWVTWGHVLPAAEASREKWFRAPERAINPGRGRSLSASPKFPASGRVPGTP